MHSMMLLQLTPPQGSCSMQAHLPSFLHTSGCDQIASRPVSGAVEQMPPGSARAVAVRVMPATKFPPGTFASFAANGALKQLTLARCIGSALVSEQTSRAPGAPRSYAYCAA